MGRFRVVYDGTRAGCVRRGLPLSGLSSDVRLAACPRSVPSRQCCSDDDDIIMITGMIMMIGVIVMILTAHDDDHEYDDDDGDRYGYGTCIGLAWYGYGTCMRLA